ncbi:MAG: ribbon-helix-helix domain-containing protein [Pseudomonadota bacterium]
MSAVPPATPETPPHPERAWPPGRHPPVKRSLTIKGHRSSVTLEEPFWQGFREIARTRNLSFNALAAEIDAARNPESPLASAIRVYVFETLRRP